MKEEKFCDIYVYRNKKEECKLYTCNDNSIPDKFYKSIEKYFDSCCVETSNYKVRIIFYKNIPEKNDFEQNILQWEDENDNIKFPIIHCLLYDKYFDLNIRHRTRFPRESNIMDSSIWNYCYSNLDSNKDEVFDRILRSICNNYELGLYNLGSAYEFADINARLCKNSYLVGGHHSDSVVPFVFHSEYLSYKALEDRIDKKSYTFDKKWRFLLLDDHAYEPMNGKTGDYDNKNNPSKLDIIVSRLKKYDDVKIITQERNGVWKGGRNDYNIAIECAESINGLLKKLFDGNKRRYDIILLDYLLKDEYSYHIFSILKVLFDIVELDNDKINEKEINTIIDNQQRNVYDINLKDYISVEGNVLKVGTLEIQLEELKDRIIGGIGPDKRLYFMYISSFTQSIQERLQDQLITRSHKYWFIGKGACPTNTPEIFLYNLYVLMEKRVATLLSNKDFSILNTTGFISKMFSDGDEIKNKCREEFIRLLRMKATYESIKNDISENDVSDYKNNGSLLVQSVFEDRKEYTYSFWEHFQHLCYLIAYGNDSQYPEMWEEYLFVKDTLQKCVSDKIKNYIVKLSNQ